mgnify:CR=1 FL=1
MKWWERKRREPPAPVVQVRQGKGQPFGALDRYVPLSSGEVELYRAIREGVPLVDAAIWKLVRLCGGTTPRCGDGRAQAGLDRFWRTVDTGWGQRGVQSFLDRYLDDLFTCGHALGEIVLTGDGRDIAAVLCADPEQVEAKRGDNPLDFKLLPASGGGAERAALAGAAAVYPPSAHGDCPCGVSMLRLCPFWRAFC